MVVVVMMIISLLAWTGAWSTHTGFGALFFCGVWIAGMGYSLVLAFMAPALMTQVLSWSVASIWGKETGKVALNLIDALDLIFNGLMFIVPSILVAIGAFLLYLIGLGDWLSSWFPKLFPPGGILFSDHSASLMAYVSLGYVLFETWSLIDRFGGFPDKKRIATLLQSAKRNGQAVSRVNK